MVIISSKDYEEYGTSNITAIPKNIAHLPIITSQEISIRDILEIIRTKYGLEFDDILNMPVIIQKTERGPIHYLPDHAPLLIFENNISIKYMPFEDRAKLCNTTGFISVYYNHEYK